MPTYKIPCSWQMCGTMHVQARTLSQAINNVHPLPHDSDYVDGSFRVDEDLLEAENENPKVLKEIRERKG